MTTPIDSNTAVSLAVNEPSAAASWAVNGAAPALAAGASLEIPASAHREAIPYLAALAPDTHIYLPHTPRSDIDETVAACRALIDAGHRPVPHLAARAIPNRDWLVHSLDRLQQAGTDSLLLIAGDQRKPRGPFSDTLQILDTGLLARYGFQRLGVAGHPEGHPVVSADAIDASLEIKRAYARDTGSEMWLVTQFVFEAAPVLAWLRGSDEAGGDLAVRVGVPGVARLRTLWRYALSCGIGTSARVLARHPGWALALAATWRPDELVTELAQQYASGHAGSMTGIHVYAFGGVQPTIQWLDALSQGLWAAN